MTADARQSAELPRIEGYAIWRGRALLHARYRGTFADARSEGRPWHVVAPSPQMLVDAVNRGRWRPP